ncbi:MAG: 3-phosphoshikimate 1-carboxyvinyltransferase [Streptosporangiaceae bacterium]
MVSDQAGQDGPAPRPADWTAPRAASPVHAVVRLPGSKSMTNRALIIAALASSPTLINGPLAARDTRLMAGALRALGCRIDEGEHEWRVEPPLARPPAVGPGEDASAGIDVGNAGTVLRFVPPVAALGRADVRFTGDPRIARRPVRPLLDALRELGAEIQDDGTGSVPFTVLGHGAVPGGAVSIDASSSSQFVSGLLLAGARFGSGVRITHRGPPVPSAPHIEMTVRMLRAAGVRVEGPGNTAGQDETQPTWRVWPGPVSAGRIEVEPDLSNALPFLAAALATGGEVTMPGWPCGSLQPASRIVELLVSMGASVRHGPDGLTVRGSGRIGGVLADLSEVGELTPVLTALAALAGSPSEFTGIGHLRRHESDRLAALTAELGKLGGDVTETADGLRIRPAPLHPARDGFDSHDDHRLVMAAAVLGLVTDGLIVRNAATVAKTFPGFTAAWTGLLAPA